MNKGLLTILPYSLGTVLAMLLGSATVASNEHGSPHLSSLETNGRWVSTPAELEHSQVGLDEASPMGGGSWDSVFGSAGTSDSVRAIAIASNGDVYVGGLFTSPESYIAKWNGSTWSGLGSGTDGIVTEIAIAGNGDVYVGGAFATAGGVTVNNIAKWNGSTWSALGSGTDGEVGALAIAGNGDVYVGGGFFSAGGNPASHIAKWNGSTWSALGSGTDEYVLTVAVAGNGDVYAGGVFTSPGSHIAKWNGSAWESLLSGTDGFVHDIDITVDGDIYVGGLFASPENDIARWHVPGGWFGLGSGVTGRVRAMALADNGAIYAGGDFLSAGGNPASHVAQWNGSTWSVLGGGTNGNIYAVAIASNGDVYVGGDFTAAGDIASLHIGLWHPAGPPTPTPTAMPTTCPIRFSDVPPASTFYDFVRCLACRSIVGGYSDGTFKPNNLVTRGQLSKIVSNAAGFTDPQTVQLFQDVPSDSTFFDFIGRLASRGYINGYTCGGPGEPCIGPANLPYFRTNKNATRGQISKIVSNSAGFSEPHTEQTFQDVPLGSTFYDFIERLASRGAMQGYACGGGGEPCVGPENRPYFRPNNNATRGQTSKIVANTFFPRCETPR